MSKRLNLINPLESSIGVLSPDIVFSSYNLNKSIVDAPPRLASVALEVVETILFVI